MMLDRVRCVAVETSRLEAEPCGYRFLLDFAKDNERIVIDPTLPEGEDYCPLPGSGLESLAKKSCVNLRRLRKRATAEKENRRFISCQQRA